MPRQPEVDRPVDLHLTLPTSWYGRLKMTLFSDLEGRVPKGAFQRFFLDRLREYYETEELDLQPFIVGLQSGQHKLRAHPETIRLLKRRFGVV